MKEIKDTSFKTAINKFGTTAHIGHDIVLSDDLRRILQPEGPKKMTFILVVLCIEGTARYTVDTQEHKIGKNDIVIISERHVVDAYTVSHDWKGLCMLMSVNFFYQAMQGVRDMSTLFLFSRNYPQVHLSQREANIFSDYFYLLQKKTADTRNHFRREVAQTLFLAMFYELSDVILRVQESTGHRQKSRTTEIFTNFIKLVEANYKSERRVGWYAGELGITPKYLSEIVREMSKRTPNEWIDSCVTLELRLLLRNTDKSIKEIADELGFSNQSFLGKYFKEHVGMSPSQYRKS